MTTAHHASRRPTTTRTSRALTALVALLASSCAADDGEKPQAAPPLDLRDIPAGVIYLGDDVSDLSTTDENDTLRGASVSKEGEERPPQDKGYYLSSTVWNRYDIPVCWETSGYSTEKAWVQNAIFTTWGAVTSVRFTGWGTCSSSSKGIRIQIADSGALVHSLGERLDGVSHGMHLNFTFAKWNTGCASNKENCIRTNAIHEFGHALGLSHEHNRPDSWMSCTADPQGTNGDTTVGGFDAESIMNYCYNASYSGRLSAGDITTIRQMYPTGRISDVGVIADADTPCPGETLTIYMDDEDSANNNSHSGWNGSFVSASSYTRMTFCRVSGTVFGSLGTQSARTSDYAVLKLGTSCPNGSYEFARYFDNEDDGNNNWKIGDIRPSVSDNNTLLRFCVFAGSTYSGYRKTALPNLGFSYGVFATPEFRFGSNYGYVYTDDEDSQNVNSYEGTAAGTSMIECSNGSSTTMHLWRR